MTFFKRILPTLFVLILVSCTTSFSEKGSIVVTMPSVSESRAICETSDVGERTISYFTVELTSGDQLINKLPIVLPGNNAEFTSLKEGDYTVTVTAVMVVQNADGTQTEIPLYQGSDTKFVKAGYAATEFAIKLVKCPEPEKPEVSYPFYAPTLQETHFHTIITAEPAETLVFQDAFDAINENQYYQLVSSRDTDADHSLPAFTINLVTKKAGQESEVTALKEDLFVTYANYIMIVCISKTETDTVPYVLLTEYGTNLYKNNYEKFVEYIDDPEYLDFYYPTYAIQLCQYMPQIYTVLWNTYKDAETIPFLNELSSDELINLGIAKINFTSATKSLFIKDFYYIYAMAGETVTIPSISKVTSFGYWNYDLSKFAYFTDKDGTKKLENSSITVSAGVTNLYVGMIGQEDDDKKDDEGDKDDKNLRSGIIEEKTVFDQYSIDKLEFKYDGVDGRGTNRLRAKIPLKNLIENCELSVGDTIVLRITAKLDTEVINPSYQLVSSTDDSYLDPASDYDKHNSQLQLKYGGFGNISIDFPINFVHKKGFDTFELFFDSESTNPIVWNKVQVQATVYPAKDSVLYFAKGYGYGNAGTPQNDLIRNEIDVWLPDEIQNIAGTLTNYTLKLSLKGYTDNNNTFNSMNQFKAHLHGSVSGGGDTSINDWSTDKVWEVPTSIDSGTELVYDAIEHNVDTGTVKLHLSHDYDKPNGDAEYINPFIIMNFSLFNVSAN